MLNFIEFQKIHKECLELSKKKNKDYGCDSLKKYGGYGILVRISDKVDRVFNLLKNNPEIKNEKIEDTLLDIINYSTYMIMLQRNKLEEVKK